jgi:hypothetical protein
MRNVLKLTLLATFFCSSNAFAQIVDPHNVLIQNVYLGDGGAKSEAVLVNILIRDNKLEIVTQDPIAIDDESIAVDARNGYLLGNLEIGETPSFIILNDDPRENFEILLDTDFFTTFAIHNGRLFRNNLFAPDREPTTRQSVTYGVADVLSRQHQVQQVGHGICLRHFPRGCRARQDALVVAGRGQR